MTNPAEQSKPFPLSKEALLKASKFANESSSSSFDQYSSRGQSNRGKIIEDIQIGKLAEEVVFTYLKPAFSKLTTPDYTIYPPSMKSWDDDLCSTEPPLSIAVKSARQESSFPLSWVFQFSKGTDHKFFGTSINPDLFVAFVSIDLPSSVAHICSIVSAQFLRDNDLFKLPKSPKLKDIKRAVYWSDLAEFRPKDQWQL